jgi:lysozyme
MDMERIKTTLIRHEGLELKPYRCTSDKLTIGVGRNLDDRGITHTTAMQMLDEDIELSIEDLRRNLSWFDEMPEPVQEALINLAFNMGIVRLMQFRKTIAFLRDGEWDKAATEMLDSRYATQVGRRADEVADMIRSAADA